MDLDDHQSKNGKTPAIVAREALSIAGEKLETAFRLAEPKISFKGRRDVVTDIDFAVEKSVKEFLLREFPDYGFLGEELGAVNFDSPFRWVLDPIDGTANFAKGIPNVATTLALTYLGEPVIGGTLDPLRDHLFFAEKDKGFTFNGKNMSFSPAEQFDRATIGLDMGPNEELVQKTLEIALGILPVHRIRIMGSAALGLAYVAAGWFDLYMHLELKPWDVAAGLLFIKESKADLVCVGPEFETANLETEKFLAGNRVLVNQCKFWQ